MTLVRIPYTPRVVQQYIHDKLDEHRFSVIVAHRRMGKTVCIINHLIKAATLCKLPNPRFAYIAPYLNQSKDIAWDYLQRYTKPFPSRQKNESELWVKIPSQSGDLARIRLYGADKPEAIKGIYLDGCVIDETAQCKQDIWDEVVRPLLWDRKGFCVFIGTPKGVSNLFADVYNKHINDPEWFVESFPATKTNLVPEDEFEKLKKDMPPNKFRQELLCDFTASSENIFIPLDISIKASKRNNQPQAYSWAPVILGVDVAREGDDSSVIYVRQGNHTLAIEKYPHMQSVTKFALPVSAAIERYGASMVFIDTVGVGGGTYDQLVDLGYQNIIMGVNGGYVADNPKYKNKRVEMWAKMKEWLIETGDIPNDPVLIAQISSVEYDHDNPQEKLSLKKKSKMKAKGIPSPDIADALSHTFFMPVMATDWDDDVGGYYQESQASPPSSITGY